MEYRNAEKHLRCRRFTEAIQSHQRAASYLQEAMQMTSSTKAYESLQCQYEYHLKQQNIVRQKQLEYENYLKAIESQRVKIANMILSNDLDCKMQTDSLQFAIFKTMNQADSLLGQLINKDEDEVDLATVVKKIDQQIQSGIKKPKGDEMVIEELKILNGQLHSLVSQLVSQLEHSNREIDTLKDRIKTLEAEKLAAKCVMNSSITNAINLEPDFKNTDPSASNNK